ncbi:MAG: glycosyl hydrolase 2 galactose-binding domain-containing protein [Candidatus Sumerlaeia bacterium]
MHQRIRLIMTVFFIMLGASWALAQPDPIWIEGEKPTSANVSAQEGGYHLGPLARPQWQSGGAMFWFSLNPNDVKDKWPEEGLRHGYQFNVKEAGRHEFWGRIGYENARSPFDWRIDGGEWKTVDSNQPTIDLIELSLWNQLGWLWIDTVDLSAGDHTIEFRHMPATKTDNKGNEKPTRNLLMIDALVFSKEPFKPNGKFKPGEDHRDELAKMAEDQVFDVEVGSGGKRSETRLAGAWQIARWDEYGDDRRWNDGDIPVETQWKGVESLPENLDSMPWYGVVVPRTYYEIDGVSGGYAGSSGSKSGKPPLFDFAHRVIYRTQIEVPAEAAGRGISLDFEQFNMIASVFVNGRFVKWSKNHDAPWELDITNHVKPGETNEIAVVIKSHYYAVNRNRAKSVEEQGVGLRAVFGLPGNAYSSSSMGPTVDFPVSAPKSDGDVPGITDYVKLIVAGGKPYVEDVFAKPSVTQKQLGLEITLENPEDRDVPVTLRNSVVPWDRAGNWRNAQPEKTFSEQSMTAQAGQRTTADLAFDWDNPTLWWPDDPNLYMIKTEVVRDGKVVDTQWTRFGFREWGWEDGVLFTINGKPWQFWNDLNNTQLKNPQTLVETMKESGRNSKRFWGKMHRGWGGMTKREILDLFDENGVVVRDTGAFDGQVFNYARGLTQNDDGSKGYNKRLFQNVLDQQLAWVRGYRNHAAILIWSMENEVAFVSAANAGQMNMYSPAIRYVGGKLMELDPTRPVMIDGGNALTDPELWEGEGPWVEPARKLGYLPVNGGHYTEDGYGVTASDFPDSFYTGEHWYEGFDDRTQTSMVRNRPIHHGEIFYGRGWSVDKLAEIGGEIVYRSDSDTYPVRSKIARMMNEGYRFNDVSSGWAIFDGDLTTDHQKAWSPIILLAREWNWSFGGGQTVERKLRIINQTSKPRTLTGKWELVVDGKTAQSGSKDFQLDIAGKEYWEVRFETPKTTGIKEGQFILTVAEGNEEHFRDEKPVRLIEWDGVPAPETKREAYVMDPSGELKKRLDQRGILYREVDSVNDVPQGPHVLLVGRNAIPEGDIDTPAWRFLANSGARIVVFEQLENPLRGRALPARMEITDQGGRIVHIQNSNHPALQGLAAADFFTWSTDHKSYAKAYIKPDSGAFPILQAGAALNFTPLVEAQTENAGLFILNQTLALTKIDEDPTARRLTDQLVNHAFDYEPLSRPAIESIPEDSYFSKMLNEAGLDASSNPDPVKAMEEVPGGIVLVKATPEKIGKLSANLDQVKAFRQKGGWIVLYDVTPEGLESFNRIVGVDHLIRPGTREAMAVVLPRGPVAIGVNMNDVVMTTGKKIDWWKGTEFRSHDAYSYIVDYRDVVPFATINGAKPERMANNMPHPRNVANGISGDEFWRYLTYFEGYQGQEPQMTFELPRKETLDTFEVAFDTGYSTVEKFTLDFHDGGEVVELKAAPGTAPQSFNFEPRTTDKVTFEITEYELNEKGRDVIGISTIRMPARRSGEFLRKVQPITDPAAIVSYPDGEGGTLLVNINYLSVEENPRNIAKKRNLTKALLANLGAPFAGGASVVVGDAGLEFEPVVLPESSFNIYPRSKVDAGGKNRWFNPGGKYRNEDVSNLPGGKQNLDGVLFDINDFFAADTPTVIALAGGGSPVETKIIKDVKVGRKADALFFLHTYHPGRQAGRIDDRIEGWKEKGEIDQLVSFDYPTVLEYVVHYADGSEVVVPVRYRREIGPWIDESRPETNAYSRVAWQAATSEAGGYLSVYSMQWNNPEPTKEIATIDIRLPEGTRNLEQHGAPAIFAISTATVE